MSRTSQFPYEFAKQVARIHGASEPSIDFSSLKYPSVPYPHLKVTLPKTSGVHEIRSGYLLTAPNLVISYDSGIRGIHNYLFPRDPTLRSWLKDVSTDKEIENSALLCAVDGGRRLSLCDADRLVQTLSSWIATVLFKTQEYLLTEEKKNVVEDYRTSFFENIQDSVIKLLHLSPEAGSYLRRVSTEDVLIRSHGKMPSLALSVIDTREKAK